MAETPLATMRLYVCTTCTDRRRGPGGRVGLRLHADLAARARDPAIEIVPVACLSVCRPSCALSFAAPGKWTYTFEVDGEIDIAIILAGAKLYAESPSAVLPWAQFPEPLKRGIVSRVPPP